MPLTAEQKQQNRFNRMLDKFRELTLQSCKARVATDFQKLVRMRAADEYGQVKCVTCDAIGVYRDFDAGHFVPRRHSLTMFDFRNCHVQCRPCNHHLSGNLAKYREFMVLTYGEKVIAELEQLSREKRKWTKEELVAMRIGFKDELKMIRLTQGNATVLRSARKRLALPVDEKADP